MASTTRQSELFAGEQWQTLYRAFTQINFNASDPTSINEAMRNYIQTNYPEDFNDWIASSEFIAIIDLLSWLAGNLAFKTDISVRENFLETAEARESILRLARFLSYNPSRNRCASGVLKLEEISTNDNVYNSLGQNLANQTISWNNPDDPNWYENIVAILNNAFVGTNPFGIPIKAGTVGGFVAQTYRLNALASANNLGFSANASGQAMDFEIVNADFVDGGSVFEKAPSPFSAMQLLYLNDSNGNTSPYTGFFFPFKQGTTQVNNFAISSPVENQLLNISTGGVNQEDVWVQTVTDTGTVLTDWIKVPSVLNSNITYNNLPVNQRNIFSVLTRDQDQISIRFSDGRFGNAPSGNLRVTYRVSNGLKYQINPQDIDRIQVPFTFITPTGATRTITFTLSLQSTVSNSAPQETEAQIAQRAPGVYSTQSRMVSGEDYNNFPLSQNLAVKLKAVNRVYSGHSRYFDLNDPTGTYKDLSIFADDGAFFKTDANSYNEVPTSQNLTPSQVQSNNIQSLLDTSEMQNFVRDYFIGLNRTGQISPVNLTWTQSLSSLYSSTGSFNASSALIQEGSMLQYNDASDILGRKKWIGVANIVGSMSTAPQVNVAGPVTLAGSLATGTTILDVLPPFHNTLTTAASAALQDKISKKLSFSLWYDYTVVGAEWSVQAPANFSNSANVQGNSILLMTVDYIPGLWRIQASGLRYVFESSNTVRFYNNGQRSFDTKTGQASLDQISILKVNPDPNDAISAGGHGYSLRKNLGLRAGNLFYYIDGTVDEKRVIVSLLDSNSDGFPDDPDLFYLATSNRVSTNGASSNLTPDNYLFWYSVNGSTIQTQIQTMVVYETSSARLSENPLDGTVAFQVSDRSFWSYTNANGWVQDFSGTYTFARGNGPNVAARWVLANGSTLTPSPLGENISFRWKHYAPSDHRIDPASTNIHDIFVLTADYDNAIRLWIAAGAKLSDMPAVPTELDLRLAFQSLEEYRMFSDAIIWRPVRYKFLFGNAADSTLKAQFKIVKLPGTSASDGEIKSKVIRAINTYFDVTHWDFGETFYFTEMAAYVHQQLAGIIASFVTVPLNSAGSFGDGFEVNSRSDEIFVSTAQVSDIVIIDSNTPLNLRIKA